MAQRAAGARRRARVRLGLTTGRVFDGATEALVTEATQADGTTAVLKLVVTRSGDDAAREITALRLAGGEGCVRLLRHDLERARRDAARRIAAHDDERAVLVHGDVHQWNALATPDGRGFKLVDPDGLLAEPEYDLGILLREDPVELLLDTDPQARARRLAARTGLDATAIWEWGNVERLSTGLLCTQIDLQPVGRQMLATADRLAAA